MTQIYLSAVLLTTLQLCGLVLGSIRTTSNRRGSLVSSGHSTSSHSLKCRTYYEASPASSVTTRTLTLQDYYSYYPVASTTVTYKETAYDFTTTVTRSGPVTSTSFYYVTVAPSTTTIPVNSGFVPIISATYSPPPTSLHVERDARGVPQRRARRRTGINRAVRPRTAQTTAQTTSYPYSVDCTKYETTEAKPYSSTKYVYKVKTIKTDTTVFDYTTEYASATSTIHTSLATRHAACDTDNIIDRFDGTLINGWGHRQFARPIDCYNPDEENCAQIRAANQSPRECCEAIFGGFASSDSYANFVFSGGCIGISGPNDSGGPVQPSNGPEEANSGGGNFFFVGPHGGGAFLGNGPHQQFYFAGFHTQGNAE